MAPLPVIADVFRVTFNWQSHNGLTAASVLHFGTPTHTEHDISVAINSHWQANQHAAGSPDAIVTSLDIIKLDGVSGSQNFPTTAFIGGNGAGQSIAQAAAVCGFHTGLRGRSNNGRVFLPFVGETDVDSGLFVPGISGNMVTAWNAFKAAMFTDGIVHVVASYKHAIANGITSYSVHNAPGTQRRRQSRLY